VAYDHAIEYLDSELGRLLDSLESRVLLEETIVIVTADHGEHLGEHGLTGHGNSLYQELLHVPGATISSSRGSRGRAARPATR
jgi:arylsulfatase A-like enzyme